MLEQSKACRKVDARGPNITVGLEPFDKSNNTGQEWQKPQPTAAERCTEIMAQALEACVRFAVCHCL